MWSGTLDSSGLFLYTVDFLCASIILCYTTSIAHDHYTDIYPLLNIQTYKHINILPVEITRKAIGRRTKKCARH